MRHSRLNVTFCQHFGACSCSFIISSEKHLLTPINIHVREVELLQPVPAGKCLFNPPLFLNPETALAARLTPDNVPSHHVQLCPGVDVQPDGDGGEKEDRARTQTPL